RQENTDGLRDRPHTSPSSASQPLEALQPQRSERRRALAQGQSKKHLKPSQQSTARLAFWSLHLSSRGSFQTLGAKYTSTRSTSPRFITKTKGDRQKSIRNRQKRITSPRGEYNVRHERKTLCSKPFLPRRRRWSSPQFRLRPRPVRARA